MDIVDRLREVKSIGGYFKDELSQEAANEIERLRKALHHCVEAIKEWERKPEGIEPYLLGAMDNAIKVLKETE